MVGQIVQPNVIRDINPDAKMEDLLPASMSQEMLTGVLRERFGFNGLVITDASIMGGYTMPMERRRVIPTTIQAGCDMICFTTDIYEDIRYVYGFAVEQYDPFADDLHGTGELPKDRLTLILANFRTASNHTTVRVNWCPKHAMENPRYVNEETYAFISFANPYHLQDIPRVRTYINAYSASAATVRAAVEKLTGKSEFQGISPVDAFCGLFDTRL